MFLSSQHFLYKNWILYVLKKKAKKIKTLFKVYLKLSLWLFNLCMSRVGGRWRHPLPHNNLSQQLFNKNTPSLARISKIKKSLLIINFPIVFQFATFPIQKLNFIRTLKKKRKRLRHCLRSTLSYHYDCLIWTLKKR